MAKIKVSRITEAVTFLMIQCRLREVPYWAWGWKYRSPREVYQTKVKNKLVTDPSSWDGTTLRQGGYAGCLCCVECKAHKPFGSFRPDTSYASGMRHICRECERGQGRKSYRRKIGREPRRYHRAKQEQLQPVAY